MTRIARREARTTGGHDIKINGRFINIYLAKMVYKCEICLSDLERHNMGLRCVADDTHRGFIHRDTVEQIKQQQEQTKAELNEFYEIENGKVVVK